MIIASSIDSLFLARPPLPFFFLFLAQSSYTLTIIRNQTTTTPYRDSPLQVKVHGEMAFGTQAGSANNNRQAHLATAYQELGNELSRTDCKVVGGYTLGRVIGEGMYMILCNGTVTLA